MSKIHEILISAYTTLVMAQRMTIEQVPTTEVTLEDMSKSTIRAEVEIEKAQREVDILTKGTAV